jgi:hypothetical protein
LILYFTGLRCTGATILQQKILHRLGLKMGKPTPKLSAKILLSTSFLQIQSPKQHVAWNIRSWHYVLAFQTPVFKPRHQRGHVYESCLSQRRAGCNMRNAYSRGNKQKSPYYPTLGKFILLPPEKHQSVVKTSDLSIQRLTLCQLSYPDKKMCMPTSNIKIKISCS